VPDIQTPDVARKLQRRYDLTAPAPTPLLGPELVPVVLVDDLSTEIDIDAATFKRPCEGMGKVAAPAAGNDAIVALVNPTGSGVLATVEWILINVDVAMEIEVEYRTGITANQFTTLGFRDPRIPGKPACSIFTGNETATTPTRYMFTHEISNRDRPIHLPWVVNAGQALVVHACTDNRPMDVAWSWTERLEQRG